MARRRRPELWRPGVRVQEHGEVRVAVLVSGGARTRPGACEGRTTLGGAAEPEWRRTSGSLPMTRGDVGDRASWRAGAAWSRTKAGPMCRANRGDE